MPPPPRPPQSQPTHQTNTVRMKPAELQKLHEELEAANQGGSHARKCIRLDYVQMSVRVEMHQSGGATISLQYAARNISSEGLGILHNSYVHPGTRCIAFLRHRDGREVPIEASAVRCRHVKGLVHEVGIRFKAPINVRDFLNVDPMEGSFTLERVDPQKLRGSLLHVEDSLMDRKLVRHYLADTALNIVSVESGKLAQERIGEGFDTIIVDNDLADMTGIQLVETLRAQGVSVPIIMLTADTSTAAKEGARQARVSAIIPKPTTRQHMLQALAEFLIIDTKGETETGGAVTSVLTPADATFKFIPEFIEELKQFAVKINHAVATDDAAGARRICYQLKGAAPALGFASIGEAAAAAMNAIDAIGGTSIAEAGKPLRQLVSLCTRAKIRDDKDQRKAG